MKFVISTEDMKYTDCCGPLVFSKVYSPYLDKDFEADSIEAATEQAERWQEEAYEKLQGMIGRGEADSSDYTYAPAIVRGLCIVENDYEYPVCESREINLQNLTDFQKDAFIDGWMDAYGYTGDRETDCPWCMPWTYRDTITVYGRDLEEAGANWWRVCRPEIERLLADEKAAKAAL